jgi:sugar lactone lactonase YvrE
MDQFYVTSASIGLDESTRAMQPKAGGLFMITPGVQGIEEIPFAA